MALGPNIENFSGKKIKKWMNGQGYTLNTSAPQEIMETGIKDIRF